MMNFLSIKAFGAGPLYMSEGLEQSCLVPSTWQSKHSTPIPSHRKTGHKSISIVLHAYGQISFIANCCMQPCKRSQTILTNWDSSRPNQHFDRVIGLNQAWHAFFAHGPVAAQDGNIRCIALHASAQILYTVLSCLRKCKVLMRIPLISFPRKFEWFLVLSHPVWRR